MKKLAMLALAGALVSGAFASDKIMGQGATFPLPVYIKTGQKFITNKQEIKSHTAVAEAEKA